MNEQEETKQFVGLQIDKPSAKGMVYPYDVVGRALKDYQKRIEEGNALIAAPTLNPGEMSGSMTRSQVHAAALHVKLDSVAGQVKSADIVGDKLILQVKPMGPKAHLLLEDGLVQLAFCGLIKLEDDWDRKIVKEIITFNFVATNGA